MHGMYEILRPLLDLDVLKIRDLNWTARSKLKWNLQEGKNISELKPDKVFQLILSCVNQTRCKCERIVLMVHFNTAFYE